MKNAILVHGRPDKEDYYNPSEPTSSNNHWFPWLSKQLMINDIFTVSLEIPKPWQPRYDIWEKELERFDIDGDTILVGHSCGGGFLVRYLSEHKDLKVGKVILVAPWTNPDKNPVSDTSDFFEFDIDPDLANRTQGITIFSSDNDHKTISETIEILQKKIHGVRVKEFHNYGHFCLEDLKTQEFPELLQECLA